MCRYPAAMPADIVPDTEHRGLIARLPPRARDYAMLARLDRPIGWWLLYWPCAWGVLLAGGGSRWGLLIWLLVGSIAMRGAGCVWNDLLDADIDARVARTALRPIASGRVSRGAALAWMLALCGVGLVVLVQLPWEAELTALASLGLVALYPLMKRWTRFPQAWLGLAFTWGAPVGWVATRSQVGRGFTDLAPMGALYAGAWCWCVGYDTIYACQDREDDALLGLGSSALTLGRHVRAGVAGFYAGAVVLWGWAIWLVRPDPLALAALAPVAIHLAWQAVSLRPAEPANVLARFRSNRFAGLAMALGCGVVGSVWS